MRILTILLFLLTFGHVASATDAALAKILESLTSQQRTLLYQYGTLSTWATPAQADSFWRVHQPALGAISPEQGKVLAAELLTNTELVYAIKKPSRLQALRGVFTASRLLLGLAGLIGAFALLMLLGKYMPGIWKWLVLRFSGVFRLLFSPRMLSWELLAVGIAIVYFGPMLSDIMLRTAVIHLGFALIWTQLTAIATRQHGAKQYVDVIRRSYGGEYSPLRIFINISVPAVLVSVAIFLGDVGVSGCVVSLRSDCAGDDRHICIAAIARYGSCFEPGVVSVSGVPSESAGPAFSCLYRDINNGMDYTVVIACHVI